MHNQYNLFRHTLAALTIIISITACSTPGASTTAVVTPSTAPVLAALPAIVSAYSDAWVALDGEKVQATFAQDGIYIDPQVPKGLTGKAIANHVNSFKGIVVKIGGHRFLPDGRTETTWKVYDQKDKLLAQGRDHFTLANGKIVRMEAFFDPM
nr:hypothetical protein [uncultured Undibacterium sp.]